MEQQQQPAGRKITRRATIIGSVIAVILVAGVGWLAWGLTHPDTTAGTAGAGAARAGAGGAGGGGGGGGPGRGPGGPGGGAGRGASTVGVATAERADIPVVIDALGTVVPQATVRVRPQVSGVLLQIL
ncbi:MAG: hypothetical protein H7255_05090, partial [Ramlibacter sp.]|nr:hypothetical protein [Ramlibacter sp.]